MNKCIGCGIKLQNTNKDKLGYTPNINNKYCERCFKTINYNEEIKIDYLDNYKIIDKINKLELFTIFITDLLHISNELINIYNSINNKKVLIINKIDILPKNIKIEHIIDNIKRVYNIKEDIYFISAKKKYNLNNIIKLIKDNNKVILCGETSSGKSTLLNNLIGSNLTTSKYDNTTLDFIKLKYEDFFIYDSPGFLISNSMYTDKILLTNKLLKEEYILNINDIKIKGNCNLNFYISDKVIMNSKKDNNNLEYKYKINNNSDIIIPGYGFIFIKNNCTIYSNKKLEIRKSLIGK